jgi:hypothetical protein
MVVKRVQVCGLTFWQGDVRDFFAAENLKVIQIRENCGDCYFTARSSPWNIDINLNTAVINPVTPVTTASEELKTSC